MSLEAKVVWSEGTLITPQHFQQSERYYDNLLQSYHHASLTYGWGFQELKFNTSGLKAGLISIEEVKGFFPDGSYIDVQYDTNSQLNIQLPPNLENEYLYLAWSQISHHQENYTSNAPDDIKTAKYVSNIIERLDYSQIKLPKRAIVVATPNLRLILTKELSENELHLPIAIVSTNAAGEVHLHPNYIPPFMEMKKFPILANYMQELEVALKQRIFALSGMLTNPSLNYTGDVRDFLMLQTINRYYSYFQHLNRLPWIHPCQVFAEWLQLYGDLSTFTTQKYAVNVPQYDHYNLEQCFRSLIQLLREVLSIVVEQRVIMLPLELKDEATRFAIIPQANLIRSGRFVLAIQASLPTETLLQYIPATIKISTIDKLNDLILYHLPGIKVKALSTVPRELPYHSGYSYFELEKESELWEDVEKASAIAIHLAGNFPDLDMECWIIKPLKQ